REYPDKRTPPYYPANVATSLGWLGNLQLETGSAAEAEGSYRRAVAVWDKLAADHASEPDEPSLRLSALACRQRLGDFYLRLGRFAEAQDVFEQCLPAAQRLAREFSSGFAYRLWVGTIHLERAHCLLGAGKRQEAQEAFDRYVALV